MTSKIDNKKFGGKYVVTKSFASNEVIASNESPEVAYNEAIEKGILEPVINYIQKEGVICLY